MHQHQKIHVLQVTHDLNVGGLQRVVSTLCAAIDRDRFDVSVLCLREAGPMSTDIESRGIRIRTLTRPRNRPDYMPFARIARLLRHDRVDVIHTHNTEPFISAGGAAVLTPGKRLVHTDHARPFPDKTRYMVLEHLLSYRAYRVVGVSDHTTANLHRYERIPARKLLTIPNGIDLAPYAVAVDRGRARAQFGVPGNGPVIGLGSRIEEQKGIIYLLRAMERLRAAFPGITLLIAGEGSARPSLEQAAIALGIAERVRFVGTVTDINTFLGALDLYVLPSIWEGLPMVVLEAMAAGCPIVASNVGGIPTAIRHGETGSLVAPTDVNGLADEVARVLGETTLRQRYRDAARRLVHERFSATAMARQYERLYLGQS